jgi:hypothetical protein
MPASRIGGAHANQAQSVGYRQGECLKHNPECENLMTDESAEVPAS